MPGTQPGEVSNLESTSRCDNCHGGYASALEPREEPSINWSGSMMAHASRDPLFWATVAIAEQDFDGSGDLCIRCHTPEGWIGGRSTPTDGSALVAGDSDGVQCDSCHRLTNPDDSEHLGEQNPPFVANDGGSPPEGHYGSGQYVLWDGSSKLGPYATTNAKHQFLQSEFHRSSDLCGTCHDVSNPIVGDLAHNHGAQTPLAPGSFSGVPGSPVAGKAAFNNFPYQYGVVERTYSEHRASLFEETRVADFAGLPDELRAPGGAIDQAYQAALAAGLGGDYADGTPRYFTCQSCHMRPVTGQGCNKNPALRADLPHHDLTGGNTWVPDAILHQNSLGQLRLGGPLTAVQITALEQGKERARSNLESAASLSVDGNRLRVVNLTGHKLISGYPEGRRMWIRTRWYDAGGSLLAEDGAYGPLPVVIDGSPSQVDTLIDLHDPYSKIYEAHGALTQEWANQLLGLGYPASLPLSFDRVSGAVAHTLGGLAAQAPGTHQESFHFALNNRIVKDNRIPPYGMRYDESLERNILPVPTGQYGNPGPGGTFEHWDEVVLDPPAGAVSAQIELLYQPTSWEYVQFLALANTGQVAFLSDEGDHLLASWLATGMAAPHAMASASWSASTPACADALDNDGDGWTDANDPGCASAGDGSEHNVSACDNRVDDDGDGLRDFPRDPGCSGPLDVAENDAAGPPIVEPDTRINWEGLLELRFARLPTEEPLALGGGGVARISVSSGSFPGALNALQIPPRHQGGVEGSERLLLTDPALAGAGIGALTLDALVADGSFAVVSAAAMSTAGLERRAMPLRGLLKLCLLDAACSGGHWSFALTAATTAGAPAGIGVGGTVTGSASTANATDPLRYTLEGAPWTLKTISVFDQTGVNVGGSLPASGTFTRRGFAHGPASATESTAAIDGVVGLVSPVQIRTDLDAGDPRHLTTLGATAGLRLRFVPEPGALPLLGAALFGLWLAPRRNRRRRTPRGPDPR